MKCPECKSVLQKLSGGHAYYCSKCEEVFKVELKGKKVKKKGFDTGKFMESLVGGKDGGW